MPLRSRRLALLVPLALAACGGSATDSEAVAPPDSVAFATPAATEAPTTTAAPATETTTSSSTPAGSDGGAGTTTAAAGEPMISAEMLSSMLATDQGRQLIVQSMAQATGIDEAAASCFVGEIDIETLAGLSSLDPAAAADPSNLPPEALTDLTDALGTCGIPVESLLG